MTEENPGNNIETLAERAKDMLERVRGASDSDALTPPPLPLSTMRDKRAEVDSADRSHADRSHDDSDATEVDDQPMSDLDDSTVEDYSTVEMADAEPRNAKPELIEIGGVPDEDEILIPEVELAETPSFDIAEDEVHETEETETAADDDVQETLVDEPIDENNVAEHEVAEHEVAELGVDVIEEDADLESLDDPFVADVQTDTDADSIEESDSLNLFGRIDEQDDYTVETDGRPQDDSTSEDFTAGDSGDHTEEAIVVDDDIAGLEFETIDADTVIAELEGLDETPVDEPTELLDLDDPTELADVDDSFELLSLDDSSEVEGVGYLGDVDAAHSGSMSTEDLIVEPDDTTNDRIESVVGLDLDDSHLAADNIEPDVDDSGVVSGSTIVAGSAAAAGAVAAASATGTASEETDTPEDAVRRRGRLSDLGPKEEPAPASQPKGRFSSRQNPAIDHDLNDLFLKPETPDQASNQRSFPWLLPMGLIAFAILAIALLFLSWYWAGDGEDNTNTNDNAQVVTEDTTPDSTPDEPTATVDSSTATTVAATTAPTTEAVAADGPTFESAADLVGVGSNTADFAELGAPLGLQQALEQLKVDENGDPVPFTLLAPSDDAIAKLTEDQLNELATDPNKARELIDYHFIDQPLTPEFLQESVGGQIMTRSGVPIFVELDGDDYVFNGNARVEIVGLEAENGSVIVIDSVLAPPTINKLLDIGNIQFKVISAIITDEGKTELQKAVTYFTENPDAEALIAGHTDTDGEAEANRRLSQRRAEAVRQFLIDAGIDGDRLDSEGFGEDEPILVNGVEDKDLSRRIEFVLK